MVAYHTLDFALNYRKVPKRNRKGAVNSRERCWIVWGRCGDASEQCGNDVTAVHEETVQECCETMWVHVPTGLV